MNPVLEIDGVRKTFPLAKGKLEVLGGVSQKIEAGSFISIVGASGCGKSTLLRIISGLETATEGQVRFHGKPVTEPTIEIGMIFQESRLFPWLTVKENIRFGIFKPSPRDDELVREHMELVGLSDFADALPKQISGGMQQRVSIARTLINCPEILLLDEPFGALDALTRIQMQNEILRIWQAQKATMLLVTHDVDEAIFLSDRIIVLSNRPGRVKKCIPVGLSRPRDRNSASFIAVRREIYQEFFQNSDLKVEYYI